ncbi:hypothetical protein HY642_01270 [Candidatus Woesearchaeota archaeon]|nr:hypothetical protein [Candidatus Woesearchaeota archaeon]
MNEDALKDLVLRLDPQASKLDLVVKSVVGVRSLPRVEYHFIQHEDGTLFAFRDDEITNEFLLLKPGSQICYGIDSTYVAGYDEWGRRVYSATPCEEFRAVQRRCIG